MSLRIAAPGHKQPEKKARLKPSTAFTCWLLNQHHQNKRKNNGYNKKHCWNEEITAACGANPTNREKVPRTTEYTSSSSNKTPSCILPVHKHHSYTHFLGVKGERKWVSILAGGGTKTGVVVGGKMANKHPSRVCHF